MSIILPPFDQVYALASPELASVDVARATRRSQTATRGGLVLTALATIVCFFVNHWLAAVAAIAGVLASLSLGGRSLTGAQAQLRRPMLEAIGKACEMAYEADVDPRAMAAGTQLLFPTANTQLFSDRFSCTVQGKRVSFCQARLSTATAGQGSTALLNGYIYTVVPTDSEATVLIRPRHRSFGHGTPPVGYQTVESPGDAAFDRQLEVYAIDPDRARIELSHELREKLLKWDSLGPLYLCVNEQQALVVIGGEDLMDRSLNSDAETSARQLYDKIAGCVDRLNEVVATLA